MGKRILIIQGHPDPAGGRFCHALADAYATGAESGGHEVRRIAIAELTMQPLRSQAEWEAAPSAEIARCQQDIAWAEHLVFLYPLWLGGMPAALKGFLEQVARPGFAFEVGPNRSSWQKKLAGRSARIVVTMGMPALIYRWYFGAHSLKSLERNILGFVGIKPIRESLIGNVAAADAGTRLAWLEKLRGLGREGT